MKAIIIALVMLSAAQSFAYGTWATLKNEAGGTINLTDLPCSTDNRYKGFFTATTYHRDGSTMRGCYYMPRGEDTVRVYWLIGSDDYAERNYPLMDFSPTEYLEKAGR